MSRLKVRYALGPWTSVVAGKLVGIALQMVDRNLEPAPWSRGTTAAFGGTPNRSQRPECGRLAASRASRLPYGSLDRSELSSPRTCGAILLLTPTATTFNRTNMVAIGARYLGLTSIQFQCRSRDSHGPSRGACCASLNTNHCLAEHEMQRLCCSAQTYTHLERPYSSANH